MTDQLELAPDDYTFCGLPVYLDRKVAPGQAFVLTADLSVLERLGVQGGDRPAEAPAELEAWLQVIFDEYVKAIGTERPRRSEYRALMEKINDQIGYPMTLEELTVNEDRARLLLLRANTQKMRARRLFVKALNKLVHTRNCGEPVEKGATRLSHTLSTGSPHEASTRKSK